MAMKQMNSMQLQSWCIMFSLVSLLYLCCDKRKLGSEWKSWRRREEEEGRERPALSIIPRSRKEFAWNSLLLVIPRSIFESQVMVGGFDRTFAGLQKGYKPASRTRTVSKGKETVQRNWCKSIISLGASNLYKNANVLPFLSSFHPSVSLLHWDSGASSLPLFLSSLTSSDVRDKVQIDCQTGHLGYMKVSGQHVWYTSKYCLERDSPKVIKEENESSPDFVSVLMKDYIRFSPSLSFQASSRV